MYRLIVVDDEYMVRNGLKAFFSDGSTGFTVSECFEDGCEALDYLRKNSADAIITDIRMAQMSGLELARLIREEKIPIKIVLLSGYKEFEYAQSAIGYKVENYLIKPVRFDELAKVFGELKEILDNEAIEEEKRKQELSQKNDLKKSYFMQFVCELEAGVLYNKEEILKRAQELGIEENILYSPNCIIKLNIENASDDIKKRWAYGIDRFYEAIQNFIRLNNDIEYYLLYNKDGVIKILTLKKLEENNISNEGFEEFVQTVSIATENGCKELMSVFSLNIKFEIQAYKDLFEIECKSVVTHMADRMRELKDMIVSCLIIGDTTSLDISLSSISIETINISNDKVKYYLIEILNCVNDALKASGQMALQPYNFIDEISQTTNTKTTIDVFNRLIRNTVNTLSCENEKPIVGVVRIAVDYINQNCHKDISLVEVAEFVYLSPMYFGRVFKQYLGESFTDYIIKTRINRAIEMLCKHNMKVFQVGEAIGYTNSKYFIRLFKKHTGFTPNEFRRNQLKKAGE